MPRATIVKTVKALVSVGLLVAIVTMIARREGMGTLADRLVHLDLALVLGAVALQLGAAVTGVVRWGLLLRVQGLDLPFPTLLRSYLVGRFLGAFTPSTSGLDVYRAVDIGRRTGEPAKSAAAIVLEKCFGLIGLAWVTFVLVPLGGRDFFGPSAYAMAGLVALGALAGIFVLRHPRVVAPIVLRLPKGLRGRVETLLGKIHAENLGVLDAVRAAVLGIASHALTAGCYAASGLALGLDTPPLDLLVVGNAIVIATLLPVSLGGVGVREGTAVFLLSHVGVPVGEATLVALLGYLATQPPALLGGLVQLLEGRTPTPPASVAGRASAGDVPSAATAPEG